MSAFPVGMMSCSDMTDFQHREQSALIFSLKVAGKLSSAHTPLPSTHFFRYLASGFQKKISLAFLCLCSTGISKHPWVSHPFLSNLSAGYNHLLKYKKFHRGFLTTVTVTKAMQVLGHTKFLHFLSCHFSK